MKTKFEKIINEKLSNYEIEYDSSSWDNFNQKLKKSNASKNTGFAKYIFMALGAVAIFTALYFYSIELNLNTKTIETKHNIVENNTMLNTDKNCEIEKQTISKTKINIVSEKSVICKHKEKDLTKHKQPISNQHIENQDTKHSKTKIISTKPNNKKIEHLVKKETIEPKSKGIEKYIVSASKYKGCSPLKINFSTSLELSNKEYLWNFGDGDESNEISPSHIYETAGNYKVFVEISDIKSGNIIRKELNKEIFVNQSPIAKFDIEQTKGECSFINQSTNGDTYNWNYGNGKTSTDFESICTYTINSTYKISLKVNNNECTDVAYKEVHINLTPNIKIPNAFTPNGGSNPYWYIAGEDLGEYKYHIEIYSKIGRKVFSSDDIFEKWDGKIYDTDQTVSFGVYSYIFIIADKYGNTTKKTGSIFVK